GVRGGTCPACWRACAVTVASCSVTPPAAVSTMNLRLSIFAFMAAPMMPDRAGSRNAFADFLQRPAMHVSLTRHNVKYLFAREEPLLMLLAQGRILDRL